jgi:hypothetical protein
MVMTVMRDLAKIEAVNNNIKMDFPRQLHVRLNETILNDSTHTP